MRCWCLVRRWKPAPEGRTSAGLSPAWAEAGLLVVVTRIVFLLVAYAATWIFAASMHLPREGFLQIWHRWDAVHYLAIAQHGYSGPGTVGYVSAFWPLLPLLVRGSSDLGLSPIAAGMAISLVATLVATGYLYRLAETEFGEGTGRKAVLYLLLFPTAVFLIAPYSEPLFLAGAVPAFYYARTQRWLAVAPAAFVAVAARPVGMFLLVGLAVEFLVQRDYSWRSVLRVGAVLLVALLPLLAYLSYLWAIRGSPFAFLTDERVGWLREFKGPVSGFLTTIRFVGDPDVEPNFRIAYAGELVAAMAGVAFTAWAASKRLWGYAAFMGTSLVPLLVSTYYFSLPRVLLSLFPVVLLIASFTRDRDLAHNIVLAIFVPVATLGVVTFTRWLWFF
jgi:Mannosyltransferase (PIG-V)